MTSPVQPALDAAADVVKSVTSGKKWYLSKTLWVNIIAASAIIIQNKYGFVLDSSTQTLILAGVNVALRAITKEALVA